MNPKYLVILWDQVKGIFAIQRPGIPLAKCANEMKGSRPSAAAQHYCWYLAELAAGVYLLVLHRLLSSELAGTAAVHCKIVKTRIGALRHSSE